ncbi:N-carbamoyl-L-amino-acid hydrolase [Bacillus thermophilus]|uniref:N-carbamoyl-L-amino-acid hydrolase n=1 Tax=Siminovitchia thermophila TaxID=1245522 RepID=A0ABS2R3V7_9BACI|nr:M20 family metallo-hydrolase [Siminovitchia thermophila]MBM7714318.1 N-carbamoyl-L-amino-acid hydrolase [Siminovitchia thermophila]ONK22217.1 Zn-dependent hydrolase [Bacillus sp. VT-16-64]
MKRDLQIHMDRLMRTIDKSADIGKLPCGGIRRLALTNEDKNMRDLYIRWLKNIDLEVRVDDFGNIYGRREGKNPNAAPVLIGSHLDTQPEGGRYDGILGVLAGLEVLTVLNESGIQTDRPIELINFTNEEGARFEPPILGAGGLSGHFDHQFVYSRTDREGKTFLDELKRIGYHGSKRNRIQNAYCYLELHIEQGPVLEHKNVDIGIVTGIQGMNWLEVKITGQSDHAGPTPMNMRKDALYAASKMIQMIKQTAVNFHHEATATVGRLSIKPNSINCVPGEVTFSVDIRHSHDTIKEQLTQLLIEKISVCAAAEKVSVQIDKIWESSATRFSESLINIIAENADKLGYSNQKMISGAGHDAKYMNRITPTAMIFVPSADGKSHCQEEFTTPQEIEKGANLLLKTVYQLANHHTNASFL